MFQTGRINAASVVEFYDALAAQLAALLHGERDFIANAANFASLLYNTMADVNWVGLYIHRAGELVLGPFQGRPACVRIAFGRGVCGAAAATMTTQVVPDVRAFAGHIACDAASRSELVAPIVAGDRLVGVLDLDSPSVGRFTEEDRIGAERLVRIFVENTDLPST